MPRGQKVSPHHRGRRKTHFLARTSTIFGADVHDPKGCWKTSLILLSPLFAKITFYPRFFVLAFFVGSPRFFEKRGVKNPRFFRLLAPFWQCIWVWTDVDWICKCTLEYLLRPISSDKRCFCPCYLCASIWRWHRLKPTFEFLSVALHENQTRQKMLRMVDGLEHREVRGGFKSQL